MPAIPVFEYRVTLVSAAPLRYLRALDTPGIAVCDVLEDDLQAVMRILTLQPHALVFAAPAQKLPAFLSTLSASRCPCPPRVVACFDTPLSDAVCLSQDLLPGALKEALRAPYGRLAAPSMPARLNCAQALLSDLGMPTRLLGHACLLQGAAWLSACPYPAPPVRFGIYQQLSQALGISPAAVERRIRSAIESTWLSGSIAAQNRLFGLSVSAERGKPTNSEFLYTLSEHIRQQLYS